MHATEHKQHERRATKKAACAALNVIFVQCQSPRAVLTCLLYTSGQLHGFLFTSDPQASGEAAKALNAAAQAALASEIAGRATRVNEAVDEAFVQANDGIIRWLGEPVGKLTAGEHILEPRVRVLCDESLNGATLDMVQKRLELWVAQNIKKLLLSLIHI